MEKKGKEALIFRRNSVEFVTVAAEYCNILESCFQMSRESFTATMTKLLPLLYLKAVVLESEEALVMKDEDAEFEQAVTEDGYEEIRSALSRLIGSGDDYLDVFVEEMRYSDQPVTQYISENLADIYQDIKNFIHIFKMGEHSAMNDSLCQCIENFRLYWGQKALGSLRALHQIRFEQPDDTHDNDPEQD